MEVCLTKIGGGDGGDGGGLGDAVGDEVQQCPRAKETAAEMKTARVLASGLQVRELVRPKVRRAE